MSRGAFTDYDEAGWDYPVLGELSNGLASLAHGAYFRRVTLPRAIIR